MTDDTIIQEIIRADLQTLYNLLEPIKEETDELKYAYIKFKHGIKIHYHISWNLKGLTETRERQNTILLKGKVYNLEEWWDEEENRRSIARKALMEYYTDNKPYEVR